MRFIKHSPIALAVSVALAATTQISTAYSQEEEAMLDTTVDGDIPERAINAVLPIVALITGCIGGLYVTGEGDTMRAWLFSRAGSIYSGSNEIQRNIIAKRVLGLPD